jgi:IclR family transcriptional regulator, pca regulon regulatory protein
MTAPLSTATSPGTPAAAPAPEFVQSLERGLSVLCAFDADNPIMTLTEVGRRTGLTRATARRLLHTLCSLGYVITDGKLFELTPRVLDLGYAYVSSLQLPQIAQPYMEDLSERVHESVSAAVLDGEQIVYVARVPTQRIMAISLAIGSRLPAAWTSMGRVLLAELDDDALTLFLATQHADAPSPQSIVEPARLFAEIVRVRHQGHCLLDQELEDGVRSVAVALRDRRGRALGALNVGTHAARVTLKELRTTILPELLSCAEAINAQLSKR